MTAGDFDQLVQAARTRQDRLLTTKGADYTRHSADRLANFKRTAAATGQSPLQVWAGLAFKHWDAILAYILTGKTESEAIEGRLDDLVNYLFLLEALVKENT